MDERDPVDDAEFVYRRIHRAFLDPKIQILVQFPAFRPNQNDTTGISVFRADFIQAVDTLAEIDAAKAKDYAVARLAVRDLRNLGLTVVPDPIPGGPHGHALIPELRLAAYQARKQHFKLVLIEMARLASADIVHHPG
jgi:hypothetical protein